MAEPSLKAYHLLPAVRGDFLVKLGRLDEARAELERAASLTQNARERALLLERAAACTRNGSATRPERRPSAAVFPSDGGPYGTSTQSVIPKEAPHRSRVYRISWRRLRNLPSACSCPDAEPRTRGGAGIRTSRSTGCHSEGGAAPQLRVPHYPGAD